MLTIPLNKEGYKLLLQGTIAFSEIQTNGIAIDVDYCKKTYEELADKIKVQEKKLYGHKEVKEWKKKYRSKFNLGSSTQLSDILFNEFNYKPKKWTTDEKTNPSTDAEALKQLKVPFTEDLILLRQLGKIRNTYIKNLIQETVNGYLHPFLDLHTTTTYRSSSSMPNAQNIPIRDPMMGKIIRQAFIPRVGHYFTEADYGGVEVKAAAVYHQDPNMLEYLRDPENSDMHADFFTQCFMMSKYDPKCKGDKDLRKAVKNCWTFPQFYGDYFGNNARAFWSWLEFEGNRIDPKKGYILNNGKPVGQQLIDNRITTFQKFERHMANIEKDMWERRFPVYAKWKENQYKLYLRQGYITSLSGFTFQGVLKKNEVVNYPIQALAFHCLLWGCIRLLKMIRKYRMKTKITFQIHDSLIGDVPKDEKRDYYDLLKQVMIHDLKDHWKFINIPLEIEVDSSKLNGNWYKMATELNYIG